jgi:multidrug efflux pump subunit AcrA (membrane-fusion protein)
MEFPNPDGRLKPGMYSTVSIAADLGEQLVVDDDAVLDTGIRQVVFVDKGAGKLEPREVMVGERTEGLAIIVKGLQAGEKVVTSGNFLVDSESRLKAALRQGGGGTSGAEGANMGTEEKPAKPEKESKPAMPPMPGM